MTVPATSGQEMMMTLTESNNIAETLIREALQAQPDSLHLQERFNPVELIDGDAMLIKPEIPADTPSVCVEDFCGYTNPGHFPISFSADYYPTLGFTRFSGEWWNVPDMPSASQPTEADVHAWALAQDRAVNHG